MAKKSNVPSQESVPHQVRFPHEAAANVDIMGTARPRTSATEGFPGEFPLPDVRTYWEMNAAGGEFMHPSHTNGKTKKE
jgi:hypothetical protein